MTATAEFPRLVPFNGPLPSGETYRPADDRIISGDPVQSAQNLFRSPDGRFNSGIWSAARGSWRVVFSEAEFCQILEGTIIVRGDDGSKTTFRAGDAFVTPAGFTGIWEVIEPAKKFYATYE